MSLPWSLTLVARGHEYGSCGLCSMAWGRRKWDRPSKPVAKESWRSTAKMTCQDFFRSNFVGRHFAHAFRSQAMLRRFQSCAIPHMSNAPERGGPATWGKESTGPQWSRTRVQSSDQPRVAEPSRARHRSCMYASAVSSDADPPRCVQHAHTHTQCAESPRPRWPRKASKESDTQNINHAFQFSKRPSCQAKAPTRLRNAISISRHDTEKRPRAHLGKVSTHRGRTAHRLPLRR